MSLETTSPTERVVTTEEGFIEVSTTTKSIVETVTPAITEVPIDLEGSGAATTFTPEEVTTLFATITPTERLTTEKSTEEVDVTTAKVVLDTETISPTERI